jgi:hypothetical protein
MQKSPAEEIFRCRAFTICYHPSGRVYRIKDESQKGWDPLSGWSNPMMTRLYFGILSGESAQGRMIVFDKKSKYF